MILGHGDLASVVPPDHAVRWPDRLYLFSGVSNSREDRESEYEREVNLITSQDPTMHAVYCSTLSVFYAETRYTRHKRWMEQLVKHHFDTSCILRIGNIDWGTNPSTIINFLRGRYLRHEPLEIQDVYRYVTSQDEFVHWLELIPDFSCEMNIPGKRMSVQEIVETYVFH